MNPRKITGRILAGISTVLTAVILFWFLRDAGEFVRSGVGINAQALRIPAAWLLAAAVALGYAGYTMWVVPSVYRHRFELSPLKLLGIWAAVVSGIVEEVVFRKRLMDLAADWGMPGGVQVLVSAALFGLAHASWVLIRGEVRIALPVVASTAVLGGLLGLVYLVADRNVLPAIAAHTAINLVIEPWLMLAAVSGTWGHEGSPPSEGSD